MNVQPLKKAMFWSAVLLLVLVGSGCDWGAIHIVVEKNISDRGAAIGKAERLRSKKMDGNVFLTPLNNYNLTIGPFTNTKVATDSMNAWKRAGIIENSSSLTVIPKNWVEEYPNAAPRDTRLTNTPSSPSGQGVDTQPPAGSGSGTGSGSGSRYSTGKGSDDTRTTTSTPRSSSNTTGKGTSDDYVIYPDN